MSNSKIVAEGEALSTLDGNEGWKIIEAWLKEAIESTKDQLANKKHNNNWNVTLRLQSKYEAYTTLLYLKQRRIEAAQKAKLDNERQEDR